MNTTDKIARDAKTLVDSVKDAITGNLLVAVKTGALDIREDQLPRLLSLVEASSDEGYQRAVRTFQKSVDKNLLVVPPAAKSSKR